MRQRSRRRSFTVTVRMPLGQPLPPSLALNANADANIGATSELAEKARFPPSTRGFEPVSCT
jgi:hypothetical protein